MLFSIFVLFFLSFCNPCAASLPLSLSLSFYPLHSLAGHSSVLATGNLSTVMGGAGNFAVRPAGAAVPVDPEVAGYVLGCSNSEVRHFSVV